MPDHVCLVPIPHKFIVILLDSYKQGQSYAQTRLIMTFYHKALCIGEH